MSKKIYSERYEVEELIAEGEIAVVYKAWDNKLKNVVALKVIHSQLSRDADFVERFREEARKTAQLRGHANIVQIFSVGNDHGSEYLVMEYFPSTNLRDQLLTQGKFSTHDAVNVTQQIAHALSYTHSCDIIHRDIKPANILLNTNQHVKLTDVGVGKALNEAPLTPTGPVIRTIKYMSPEQARNTILDGRTDLYSLGMVFYEMVTGQNLWKDIPNLTIRRNLQAQSTVPSLNFPPEVPLGIQAAIEDLLQYYPSDRVQTAENFIARLEDLRPLWSNNSSNKKSDDSDTTILIPRTEKLERVKDDNIAATPPPPTIPHTTQQPSIQSKGQVKEHADGQNATEEFFVDDPASKIKDPAKPYYWTDDSDAFNTHREKIEATTSLFSNQAKAPMTNTQNFLSLRKNGAVVAVMILVGAFFYWNKGFFSQSQPPQGELPIQELVIADDPVTEQTQQAKTMTDTQAPEQVQRAQAVTEVQTSVVQTQQAKALADMQATEQAQQAKALADAKTTEQAQQAKALADAKAAERVKKAKTMAAQRAFTVETQILMNVLEDLRWFIAKRDLLALERLSTMSKSRQRMLKDLFSRYITIEISIGNVTRTGNKATATLQITKLIRPNGAIVQPHPMVQKINVVVPKDGDTWNRPIW